MKKNKKSLKVTWSNESDGSLKEDEEEAEDLTSQYISFPAIFSRKSRGVANCVATSEATSDDGDSNCKEISNKDFLVGYEILLKKFDKMILYNKCLEKEKENVKKKLGECQEKLSYAKKTTESMNKDKAKLDEMLSVGRPSKAWQGIWYIGETSRVKKNDWGVVFVKSYA